MGNKYFLVIFICFLFNSAKCDILLSNDNTTDVDSTEGKSTTDPSTADGNNETKSINATVLIITEPALDENTTKMAGDLINGTPSDIDEANNGSMGSAEINFNKTFPVVKEANIFLNAMSNEISSSTPSMDEEEMVDLVAENNTSWEEGGCVNVSQSEVIKINATGQTPIRIGHWTLVRWGFFGSDWMCDLRGSRKIRPFSSPDVETIRVTVNPSGQMEVGQMQMRCDAIKGPSCNPIPFKRNCQQLKSMDYCFRLRIRCDNTEMEEELESLRGQKWITFGYGSLCGFIIGCIIAAIFMMCLDDCCQISKSSKRKKRSIE